MTMPTPPKRTPTASGTIVLIQGPCLQALSWEHWVSRYSARGYCVIATGVPSTATDEDRLCVPDQDVATAMCDYYERLLKTVTAPPILIGHCFGGLVVQLLLNRGYGAAGVAMHAPLLRQRRVRSGRAPLLFIGGGQDRKVLARTV